MPENNESKFNVTADDINAYDWQNLIAHSKCNECDEFAEIFFSKGTELQKSGDDRGRRVFGLLGVSASFRANYDSKENPYQPSWHGYGKRGMMADDLATKDLDVLSNILRAIADPEFRARIADILWICKKDVAAAQIAIDAFLESAARLEDHILWPTFVARLQRALQIAGVRGFDKSKYAHVVQTIENLIAKYETNQKAGLLCERLMGFLFSRRVGNAKHYAKVAEEIARSNIAAHEFNFAHEYWMQAAAWHHLAGDAALSQAALIEAAEAHAAKAEANLQGSTPSFGFASHWMGRAVEGLRQAKAAPNRINELYQRFLELQRLSLEEIKTTVVGHEEFPQLKEIQEQAANDARKHVSGYSLEFAIFRLAFVSDPVDPSKLREQIEKQAKESPFAYLFPTSTISSTGKITDNAPPVGIGTEKERNEAMQKAMFHQASIVDWPTKVNLYIYPALQQIIQEHHIRARDLAFLVSNNPFIPSGSEGIYARGLAAGFHDDWLVAMHLLIPRLENSIRYIFEQNGQIVSTLESDGTQQERDLGWLLTQQEMRRFFGERLTFDLRGLLIEKFGHNFRNNLAHGLLQEGAFYSEAAVYIWWLAIRLCAIPFLQPQSNTRENDIRVAAYYIWRERERSSAPGDTSSDWLQAERIYDEKTKTIVFE